MKEQLLSRHLLANGEVSFRLDICQAFIHDYLAVVFVFLQFPPIDVTSGSKVKF